MSLGPLEYRLHGQTGRMDFHSVSDIPFGVCILIYGCGQAGATLHRVLLERRKDVRILGFMDTFKTGEMNGLPIFGPEQQDDEEIRDCLLVVASTHWDRIEPLLKRPGLVIDVGFYRRLAYVSLELGCVYLTIPKCASSSVVRCLADSEGRDLIGNWKEDLQAVHDMEGVDTKSVFIFTFVRNPWDRLVSFYRSVFLGQTEERRRKFIKPIARAVGRAEVRFEDFLAFVCGNSDEIANMHWRSQHKTIYNSLGESLCGFVGKFENLTHDFKVVCDRLGILAELPRVNPGVFREADYRGYYNSETQEMVRIRYARDLELFGYEF